MIPSGMPTLHRRLAVLALSVVAPALLSARQAAQPATAGDMIDRIFKTREFTARPPAPAQWLDGGASYVVVETSPTGQNAVVKYDSATGAKREVATARRSSHRPARADRSRSKSSRGRPTASACWCSPIPGECGEPTHAATTGCSTAAPER